MHAERQGKILMTEGGIDSKLIFCVEHENDNDVFLNSFRSCVECHGLVVGCCVISIIFRIVVKILRWFSKTPPPLPPPLDIALFNTLFNTLFLNIKSPYLEAL